MARKTKLTPELQEKVCNALKAASTRADAAKFAGIDPDTFYRWMRKGKAQKRGAFRRFYGAVREAEARCAVRACASITKAFEKDWRAAAWWLSRRRKAFRDRQETKVKGPGPKGEILTQINLDPHGLRNLSDEELETLARLLDKAGGTGTAATDSAGSRAPDPRHNSGDNQAPGGLG
jgi:hypothetical protein